MNITKANIHDLPRLWANVLAQDLVTDCPKYAHMLEVKGPYVVIEEFWPGCREEVEAMLTDLLNLESNYG